jgi:hypothetical protein
MSIEPTLSQQTLGLLRKMLDGMEPESLLTQYEIRKFWKDTLFDFGFAPAIIQVASSGYNFRWGDIIPALYIGNFPAKSSAFTGPLPPQMCEEILKRLLALALHHYRGFLFFHAGILSSKNSLHAHPQRRDLGGLCSVDSPNTTDTFRRFEVSSHTRASQK